MGVAFTLSGAFFNSPSSLEIDFPKRNSRPSGRKPARCKCGEMRPSTGSGQTLRYAASPLLRVRVTQRRLRAKRTQSSSSQVGPQGRIEGEGAMPARGSARHAGVVKSGILQERFADHPHWIPACAGMTNENQIRRGSREVGSDRRGRNHRLP